MKVLTSDVMYRCASANDPHPNESEEGDEDIADKTKCESGPVSD